MILKAKWILPITAPPIEDGVVVIEGQRIAALGPRCQFTSAEIEDLGDAIIMPGLINAHTHLELSGLHGRIEKPGDLADWLLKVVQHERSLSAAELQEFVKASVRKGVAESLSAGVTTLGDISRHAQLTRPLLRDGPLRVVSFGEVVGIGTRRHHVAERLRRAADERYDSQFLSTALSPHAPYSIDGAGIVEVTTHARIRRMRTCMHLAESVEEIQFLQTGQGRFRELLEKLGVWDERIAIPGTTPVRFVHALGALGPECLIAHGNYVDEQEIDLLCATGTSVAFCPRTHSFFGHQAYPLMELLGGGVNVCVGTDSLASNPSLSVLEELIHVRRQHPEMPADAILALGTINAARALGLAHRIGSLELGKKADIAVFRSDGASGILPEEVLLTRACRLEQLYVAGQRVTSLGS